MNLDGAIDLVGYIYHWPEKGRTQIAWRDRGDKIPECKGPDRYKLLGYTECISWDEAARLVEAMTGRRPRRRGDKGRARREKSYREGIVSGRGDFPASGARVNSFYRPGTTVHPLQARIMDTLNIIRDKGDVKHARVSRSELYALAWQVLECHRFGEPSDKEPVILVGRKPWHDGFIEALDHYGIEYERILA